MTTKLCTQCSNYRGTLGLLCSAPQNGISPVNGNNNVRFAASLRANDAMCGKEAMWFVPLPKNDVKPWWKFWE